MRTTAFSLAAVALAAVSAVLLLGRWRHEPETQLAPRASPPDVATSESPPSPPATRPGDVTRASPEEIEIDSPVDRQAMEKLGGWHRLRGRVVDESSGTGIPEFRIEVEGTSQGSTSDADGRFCLVLNLDLEGEEVATLRLLPPTGWIVAVERYAISPEILRLGHELVVWANRVPTEPWRFTLVDEATGEPVPHFAILAEARDGSSAELVSDDKGVVVVEAKLSGRRLTLQCRDHPALRSAWEDEPARSMDPPLHDAPRPQLAIPVGPTYRLHVEGVSSDRPPNLRALLSPLAWRAEGRFSSHAAPVRTEGGGWEWVRFGPLRAAPGPGPPWVLQLWIEGPDLYGEVEVRHARGIHPGILDVLLEGPGEVRGLVWNEDDDVPIAGAVITLDAVDGRPGILPDLQARSAQGGSFRFARVRAGTWSIGAHAVGYPPARATLEVVSGEMAEHEFRLRAAVRFGEVSGTLTSETGRFSIPTPLVLTPSEGGVSAHKEVTWQEQEDGSLVAPFLFENVPHGAYRLSLAAAPRGYLWEPRSMEVSCPEEGIVFLCRDNLEPIDFCIRAVDASTGQAMPRIWVFVDTRVDGDCVSRSVQGPMPSGVTVGAVFPGRTNLDWVVGAPGFAPVRGDGSSLAEVSGPTGPALLAEALLEPGWGILLEVLETRQEGQGPPVAGAKVYTDGHLLGVTGADGRLLLRSPRAPERLEVKAASSRVAGAEPFDEEGRLRSEFMVYGRVWMH